MKELQSFLTRCSSDYLSAYHCCRVLRQELRPVAIRCLELFVRHASLVRPLSDAGKMRLAGDFAQVDIPFLHILLFLRIITKEIY